MNEPSVWALLAGLVAIAISIIGAVVAARAKQEPLSLEVVEEAFSPLRQVIDEAEGWVAVAQHLWETGQIPEVNGDKDPRFFFVYAQVRKALPDVDAQTLEYGIEAAVKFVKAGIAKGKITLNGNGVALTTGSHAAQ